MMFEPGDLVLYAAEGVFRVEKRASLSFYGTDAEYYVLRSIFKSNGVIYVPAASEAAQKK